MKVSLCSIFLAAYEARRMGHSYYSKNLASSGSVFRNRREKQILLSPASVDMGGMLITPREEDFNKISVGDVIDIFQRGLYGYSNCTDADQ